MPADWAWLPPELQDLIVVHLRRVLVFPDLCQERLGNARLISKYFADNDKLRCWLGLFCPVEHPGFSIHFVESVVRLASEVITLWYDDKVHVIWTTLFSQIYSQVYCACTLKPPNNQSSQLYDALFSKVRDLEAGGALKDMQGLKRDKFIHFLAHAFKYLDRFYIKRLSLPELRPHIGAAFEAARPREAAA